MSPQPSEFWPFAKIANETAKKTYPANWRARRDDFLDALLCEFWSGSSADGANPRPVFDIKIDKTDPITRDFVWRMLGDYGKPQIVRHVREGDKYPMKCWPQQASRITETVA